MVRNAMFRRVDLAARDDLDGLDPARAGVRGPGRATAEVEMTRSAWDAALEEYYAEHDTVGTGADARGPTCSGSPRRARRGGSGRCGRPSTTPSGHHDWVIDAVVDLDASDEAGELVLMTTAMHRL